MARGWIHTTYRDPLWVNVVEGSESPLSSHLTKSEAVEHGRKLAIRAGTEHVVHNRDGSIAYRNTYGPDPYPPAG